MCIYACPSVYTYVEEPQRSEEALDPLELELGTAVSWEPNLSSQKVSSLTL